jgi:hypothetical protein
MPLNPREPRAPGSAGDSVTTTDSDNTPDTGNTGNEELALAAGAVGGLVSALLGLLLLGGVEPLFGRGSIAEIAATAAMVTAFGSSCVILVRVTARTRPWMLGTRRWRQVVHVLSLSVLVAMLAFLTTSVLFAVIIAQAFQGVALDRFGGTFWVALAGGTWSYLAGSIMARLTAQSLSGLLAVFVITGGISAALSSPDPRWWEHHFSSLGAAADAAGTTFNLTLLLSALALVTVSDVLTHELGMWVRAAGERTWKVTWVRVDLLLLGASTALVGLIPVTWHKMIHDIAAQSMVLVFVVGLLSFPALLRNLPGGFRAIMALYKGLGYLNLTAFEIGATATVLIWLVLFIRTVAAAADDMRAHEVVPAAVPVVAAPPALSANREVLVRQGGLHLSDGDLPEMEHARREDRIGPDLDRRRKV